MSLERKQTKIKSFLKKAREQRNLSQVQWGAALGLHKGFIARYEIEGTDGIPNHYITAVRNVLTKAEKEELMSLITEYYRSLLLME